ncbi:MAG: adenylate/guanylate cyclase domain-containing protein [Acidimicrobiia bacterium]|nr:MAG: adenylate/guanylate cyclase domain-containing protein [Acidimicrobiia bacterium]
MEQTPATEAFVPAGMLSWLAPAMDDAVPSRRVEAVVLFCDISSFTTIANRLVDQGREGLDTLRSTLNSTFDAWITSIDAHGGTVARFIGDAIIAVWRIEAATGYEAAIRSARAAGEAIVGSGTDPLSVAGLDVHSKCGIGVGPFDIMSISLGDDQRELVVDGEALRRATAASSAGDPETVELSDGRTESFDGGATAYHDLAPALTASHIPRPIRDRLTAGQGDWLGELRLISIMFIGLPEARDARSIQRAASLITGSIDSHQDQLIKINVDDKGVVMMIVYGAPSSRDDDPVRAISASLAVSEALGLADVSHSVGLASGRAFCGAIGNELRRDYNITGHVANLASRLMTMRDGVLVDRATFTIVGPRFVLENGRQLTLKGIDGPVEAGHPEPAAGIDDTGSAALVGRTAEREAVRQLLDGGFLTLLMEGEAGMGKSALAHYAATVAQDAGWLVIGGSGNLAGERQPYGVWQRTLPVTFERDAVRKAVHELAERDPWFADRRPLAGAFTQETLPDTALTREMTGRVRAENTREVLLRLLGALIDGRTTLLILEDAQWFDSASWALLRAVALDGTVDRILLNFRPIDGPNPVELAQLAAAPSSRSVLLGDMARSDIEALLKSLLDVDIVPPEVVERMTESGAANPLFAEQLAYALLDTGQIAVQGRALRVSVADFGQSPMLTDTLESILISRIDRAPQPAQLTLKVASVIGREFAITTLEAVHPVSHYDTVEADTEVLSEKRLLRLLSRPPGAEYEFWHRLTRDAAYQLLPDSERAVLHERVARWFEKDENSVGSSVLAHHFLAAQQWAAAAVYVERAAVEARQAHSEIEVVRQLRTLQDLAEDGRAPAAPSDLARWLRFEAEALMELGHYVEARQRYKEALRLWENNFADGRLRQAGGLIASFGSLLRGTDPLDDPSPRRAAAESALILPLLAQMAYFDQNLLEMAYATLRGIRFAEQSGDPVSLARAHGAWSVVAGLSLMQRLARRSNRRSLEEANRDGGVQAIAYANLLHGILHYSRGNWDEAEEGFQRALDGYHLLGATADSDTTNAAFAFLELFRGDAKAMLARLDLISSLPRNQVALWRAAGRVIAALMTGQPASDEVLGELEQTLFEPRLEKGDALLGWGIIAVVAAQRRDREQLGVALIAIKEWLVGLPPATAYTGFGLYGAVLAGVSVTAAPIQGRRAAYKLARRSARHLRVAAVQNPVIRPLAHLGAAQVARTSIARRWHEYRAAKLATHLGTAYVAPLSRHTSTFSAPPPPSEPGKETAS